MQGGLGIEEVVSRSCMEQAAFGGCAGVAELELENSAPLILPIPLGIFDRMGMETADVCGHVWWAAESLKSATVA